MLWRACLLLLSSLPFQSSPRQQLHNALDQQLQLSRAPCYLATRAEQTSFCTPTFTLLVLASPADDSLNVQRSELVAQAHPSVREDSFECVAVWSQSCRSVKPGESSREAR